MTISPLPTPTPYKHYIPTRTPQAASSAPLPVAGAPVAYVATSAPPSPPPVVLLPATGYNVFEWWIILAGVAAIILGVGDKWKNRKSK